MSSKIFIIEVANSNNGKNLEQKGQQRATFKEKFLQNIFKFKFHLTSFFF